MRASVIATGITVAVHSVAGQTPPWQPSAGHNQMPIWPALPPGVAHAASDSESLGTAEKLVAGKPWRYIRDVSKPTLTVYSPHGKNTGAAIVVFPGGGYQILAIDLEGTEVCDWLIRHYLRAVEVPGAQHRDLMGPDVRLLPQHEIIAGTGRRAENAWPRSSSCRGMAH
jgi:hypothetical protein